MTTRINPEFMDEVRKNDHLISKVLSDREQKILRLRYEDYKSYSEIAEIEGVTKERIRQIDGKARRKLRFANGS